jgi:hypothetical protein
MALKPGINEARWMATGAVILLVVMLVVMHFQKGESPVEQLALKSRRLELVNQIRLSLASATEAEKSAVMAITDEDSQKFADQARAGTAAAEQARRELKKISKPGELDSFSTAFAEFQRVDAGVLELAVKNTNLKASALAFGPATAAVKELDAALVGVTSPAATGARVGAWRLLASLPPHIAEESDAKMDAMEADMAKEDRQIRQSLAEVADPTATASYEKFSELRSQILKLSRENTNVRSLTLSLTQKRNVTAECQAALAAVQQAIQNESVPGMTPGKVIEPR